MSSSEPFFCLMMRKLRFITLKYSTFAANPSQFSLEEIWKRREMLYLLHNFYLYIICSLTQALMLFCCCLVVYINILQTVSWVERCLFFKSYHKLLATFATKLHISYFKMQLEYTYIICSISLLWLKLMNMLLWYNGESVVKCFYALRSCNQILWIVLG